MKSARSVAAADALAEGASQGSDGADVAVTRLQADKLGYVADLLRELHEISDSCRARSLSALIALAQVEASRCASEAARKGGSRC